MIVKCDELGNLSGNCKIEMKNTSYEDKKRTIKGYMMVSMYGTIENPVLEVVGAAWDITDWSISFGPALPGDIPVTPPEPGDKNFNIYFPADEVPLGQDGTKVIDIIKHYNWTSKVYKGDNLSGDDVSVFEYNPSCYVSGSMYVQGSINRYGDNTLFISFQNPIGESKDYDIILKDTQKSAYQIKCSVNNGR